MNKKERLAYYRMGYEEGFTKACNLMKWKADDLMRKTMFEEMESVVDVRTNTAHGGR